jgi:hypothetical protein
MKYCSQRKYFTFNYPDAVPESQTLLTGIRGKKDSENTTVDSKYNCKQLQIRNFFYLFR